MNMPVRMTTNLMRMVAISLRQKYQDTLKKAHRLAGFLEKLKELQKLLFGRELGTS